MRLLRGAHPGIGWNIGVTLSRRGDLRDGRELGDRHHAVDDPVGGGGLG